MLRPSLRLATTSQLPPAVAERVSELLVEAGMRVELWSSGSAAPNSPDLRLVTQPAAEDLLIYERILVPVDRFATLMEGVNLEDLRGVWSGRALSADIGTIYPDQELLAELQALFGPAGATVKPLPGAGAVADVLWADPLGVGIVSFDALTPRLRALRVNGFSAVDNRLDPRRWPLATRAWLRAESPRGRQALTRLAEFPLSTNRDWARLTVVNMTGVTAMVRGLAAAIEDSGDDAFPARIVGPELAAADITTISNEVPFVDGCVADRRSTDLIFCSRPGYWAALELTGVDLIGLTGNHMNDYGTAAFSWSLEFYRQRGVRTYGGGANAEAALAPLVVEDHGNRLAFIGANQHGPPSYWSRSGEPVSAWAGYDSPGAARFDRAQMTAAIRALRGQVDVIFAEVQHTETNAAGDYQTQPVSGQLADFRALSDAGADVVTGVQAHTPQAIELRGSGIILYGLGNLFFDQVYRWPTRTGLVARHTIYGGRLLHTELLVTVIDSNMQTRWATPEERAGVLREVFRASFW